MMEKGSDNLRERLLARMPQPENVAAYREETESLLAKHKKALSTEKWTAYLLIVCVYVIVMLILNGWAARHGAEVASMFEGIASVLFLIVLYMGLESVIHRYQVDLLKEVKQVQLQVLELQASLRKDGAQ
jgi:hypothetical protein